MLLLKTCKKCGENKSLDAFHNHLSTKDGKRNTCRNCTLLQNKLWATENKEKRKKAASLLYSRKKEKYKEHGRVWREKNREKWNEYGRKRSQTEQGKIQSAKFSAKRRARIKSATYSWEEELNTFVIDEAYSLAQRRRDATKMDWHVDHIIPLKGKLVCGLHVWNNLKVILGKENCRKSNHFEVI